MIIALLLLSLSLTSFAFAFAKIESLDIEEAIKKYKNRRAWFIVLLISMIALMLWSAHMIWKAKALAYLNEQRKKKFFEKCIGDTESVQNELNANLFLLEELIKQYNRLTSALLNSNFEVGYYGTSTT